jgi:hypothetical protein
LFQTVLFMYPLCLKLTIKGPIKHFKCISWLSLWFSTIFGPLPLVTQDTFPPRGPISLVLDKLDKPRSIRVGVLIPQARPNHGKINSDPGAYLQKILSSSLKI